MKILRSFPMLVGLLSITAPVACAGSQPVDLAQTDGGTTEPAPDVTATVEAVHDTASFCTALCERQEECDTATDKQTCKNDCINREAAVFPKLREDVVDHIVACFAEKDCKTVLGGDVVSACSAEGVASVAPSDAAVTFCAAMEKAKKKCGSKIDKAACLDQAKLYDDEAIAEANNCTGRPCSEVDTCIGAAFGGVETATPQKPAGSTCSSGQFSELGTCSTCAEQSCCAEATACAADSYCRSMMRVCSANYSSPSTCDSYVQSSTTSSQDLASAYFQCAATSCSASCRLVQ